MYLEGYSEVERGDPIKVMLDGHEYDSHIRSVNRMELEIDVAGTFVRIEMPMTNEAIWARGQKHLAAAGKEVEEIPIAS